METRAKQPRETYDLTLDLMAVAFEPLQKCYMETEHIPVNKFGVKRSLFMR
jgi:hypothetical protein